MVKKMAESISLLNMTSSRDKNSDTKRYKTKRTKFFIFFISELLEDMKDLDELYEETKAMNKERGLIPYINECMSIKYIEKSVSKSMSIFPLTTI